MAFRKGIMPGDSEEQHATVAKATVGHLPYDCFFDLRVDVLARSWDCIYFPTTSSPLSKFFSFLFFHTPRRDWNVRSSVALFLGDTVQHLLHPLPSACCPIATTYFANIILQHGACWCDWYGSFSGGAPARASQIHPCKGSRGM